MRFAVALVAVLAASALPFLLDGIGSASRGMHGAAYAQNAPAGAEEVAVQMVSALESRGPPISVLMRQSVGHGLADAGPDAFAFPLPPHSELTQGYAEGWAQALARLTPSHANGMVFVGQSPQDYFFASAIAALALPEHWQGGTYHTNGSWRADAAAMNLARLRGLTLQQTSAWYGALRRFEGFYIAAVPLLLLRHGSLFEGEALDSGRSASALQRVAGLPADVVQAWAVAADTNQATAAMSLVGIDGLFSGADFNNALFVQALPIAQTLASSRPPGRPGNAAAPTSKSSPANKVGAT